MRWMRLLAADPGSLLCDSNQILTTFIAFTRTCPIILNLKCAPIYNRIIRMGEHDIVVGSVIVRSKGGVAALELRTPWEL